MTPTPSPTCPATTLFRHRRHTAEYRCDLPVGHAGYHTSTQGEQTVTWTATEPADGEA